MRPFGTHERPLAVAVIGSGISGLSAAWLLSKAHKVTLFEADARFGGHSHTVDVGNHAVDTGFIVYNERTYPNLTALFSHLSISTQPTEMSFSVSIDGGRLEYSGSNLTGLFAQPSNALSARFWSMLLDIRRFYRTAPVDQRKLGPMSLEAYLSSRGYGEAFRDDHLYPMAAAIWSTPTAQIGDYPAAALIDFFNNHGLLTLTDRPVWRTVTGGSRAYVRQMLATMDVRAISNCPVVSMRREPGFIEVTDRSGNVHVFDHAVLAVHADDALAILADPTPSERSLLGAFRYTPNEAFLHRDPTLMPRRRAAWASWNYLSSMAETRKASVSYWMNRLQRLSEKQPVFVTLNPLREPAADTVICRETYTHPMFDAAAIAAQESLWSLQGVRRTWFCGAYFGAGFHEDGLQSGLAVAEALGGVARPWRVQNPSGRIQIPAGAQVPSVAA